MVEERKRVMGELAAWQVGNIAVMLGGEMPDIEKLNPYANEYVESDAKKEADQQRFFGRLSVGLFGKNVFAPTLE